MFEIILNQITDLLIHIGVAVILAVIILRGSALLFGINLVQQVKEKNQAAAWFSLGIMLMLGLIVGLFKI